MTKPNVESEAPPGVVSAANAEGVGRRRRTSKRRSRARERKCSATGPAPATGEGGAGGRARRPPEPSAKCQARAHYPPGTMPVFALNKAVPPGTMPVLVFDAKSNIRLACDLKAEMNLRTPKKLRVAGASLKATHSKDASRRGSKPKGDALQRRFASQEQTGAH